MGFCRYEHQSAVGRSPAAIRQINAEFSRAFAVTGYASGGIDRRLPKKLGTYFRRGRSARLRD